MGPSGGGKSTVAALLLRFIEPSRGEITVDASPPVSETSLNPIVGAPLPAPAQWRSRVAYVPQRPYLFHDTVLANIRLSRPDASLEQVISAARQAEAHDFIQALPQGYHTLVGERGARLSGGEAQRIALARAFLKEAPFIILDEPTANLDPETESNLQQAMQRLLQGRTALIIAHRLSTIREADCIVVLDQGPVVESGSHPELLQQRGLYYRLVHAAERKTSGIASARTLFLSRGEEEGMKLGTRFYLPGMGDRDREAGI